MNRLQLGAIEIDYALHGPEHGRPLLLIMGLGMQRIAWPESLLDALSTRGFRCISFDNRDIGLSSRFNQRAPSMARLIAGRLSGRPPPLAYALSDIADDAAGLLQHLGIEHADVCGISMGGMIAQHFAARHSQRLRSLVLMASSSGRLGLPPPKLPVLRQVFGRPSGRVSVDAAVQYMVDLFGIIGSPGYPMVIDELRRRALQGVLRAPTGEGVSRQLAAIIADGSRVPLLRGLTAPTLVLHGRDDPMLPPAHGRDLARHIPGAELQILEGWGHDLPDALAERFAELIARHCVASDAQN